MDMVLMKRAANRIGWKVFEARSGNAGLEIYKSKMSDPYWMSGCSPHPFDMVFLDLKLGDIPGPDVFAAIKSLHRGQPVAIVSAYASQYDLNAMAKTGYVGLIVKPFTIENLEEVLAVHNLPLRVEN